MDWEREKKYYIINCDEHLFNYYPISKRYRCIKCQLVTRTIGENDKLLKKRMGN